MTYQADGSAHGDFAHSVPDFVHGDVHRVLDVPAFILAPGADVNDSSERVSGDGVHFILEELLHPAVDHIVYDEPRHVDQVLGGGVLGRVGQV